MNSLQMQSVAVNGHSLNYYRQGSGDVLLLVHGITTYSFIWRNIFPILSKQFDVIAIDLLGCGDSDKPLDVDYSIKSHSILLKQFLDALNISKIHFVGHDVGGGIGQRMAVDHPGLLKSLILANAVAFDFWPVQPITIMRTPIIRQLMMATLDIGVFRIVVKRGIFHKEKVTDELMGYFWKPMKTSNGRKAFLHFASCLKNTDLTEISQNLKTLSIPVQIIRGEADVYLSASIAQKLNNEIPGSELVLVPDAGHFIQEDSPDRLVECILEFLKKRS